MSQTAYYQQLKINGSAAQQAAVIVRHLITRFETGPVLLVCDSPQATKKTMVSAWQKLSQDYKQQRNQAYKTDDKLRLTRRLIKIQNYAIDDKTYTNNLRLASYQDLLNLPQDFRPKTIYLLDDINSPQLRKYLLGLASSPLVIGQLPQSAVISLGLSDKSELDKSAEAAWQAITIFFKSRNISLRELVGPSQQRVGQINSALDTLLDETNAREFIGLVNEFSHYARQAAPLNWSKQRVIEQQTVAVLANQVTTFVSSLTVLPISEDEDPVFFLSDRHKLSLTLNWLSLVPSRLAIGASS
jgi:hypothetical protein